MNGIATWFRKGREHDLAGVIHLALVWVCFLAWFCLLPGIPWGLAVTPLAALAFQQHLAGVIHEAAHGLFYRGNRRVNDFLGNWGASFLFGYTLRAYRKEHFKHHARADFLNEDDGETAEYRVASRADMIRGFLRDLCFVTALRMAVFRLRPASSPAESTTGPSKKDWSFLQILALSAVLWGGLALLGSAWGVVLYWWCFLTLYPLSNRVRVYATHGDITKEPGTLNTEVAVNVLSPVYERIFFGNRMLMYHHEHHRNPHLPFREIERMAWERHAAGGGKDNYRISIPSYLFAVRKLLFRRRPEQSVRPFRARIPAVPPNAHFPGPEAGRYHQGRDQAAVEPA